jgi:ubiquinone/menaquinone biosynthesis C-methylase UbiE
MGYIESAIFDPITNAYDDWYDTPEGDAISQEEVKCLRCVTDEYTFRWIEVGVGTGRFASALGITHGIDPSPQMLNIARRRGVSVQVGYAEQLPFRDCLFDGVLMVLTLCFVEAPAWTFLECTRILRDKGRLIVGTIPADSPWGRAYKKKGAEGHPVYSHARFRTITETIRYALQANFKLRKSCSALLGEPDSQPTGFSRIEPGIVTGAGFVGLLFESHRSGE